MLKEIEKTIGFFVIIFIIGSILIGEEAGFLAPPGYAYDEVCS